MSFFRIVTFSLFSVLLFTQNLCALKICASVDECARDLESLVAINSGSQNVLGLEKSARWIQDRLELLGMKTEWNSVTRALTAEWKEDASLEAKEVILVGHLDTVFEISHPFQVATRVSDADPSSKIFKTKPSIVLNGPGVSDAKGGVILILKVLEAWRNQKDFEVKKKKLKLKVFISGDEEIGSQFSRASLLTYSKNARMALVFEPGWMDFERGITRLASQVGGNLFLGMEFDVISSHSGASNKLGKSSADSLASAVIALGKLREPDLSVNVYKMSTNSKNNVTSSSSELKASIRYRDFKQEQKILKTLEEIRSHFEKAGIRLSYSTDFRWKPHRISDEADIHILQKVARKMGHPEIVPSISLTRSAASFLAEAGIKVIDGMGLPGANYHGEKEVVYFAGYHAKLAMLSELLKNLAEDH